MQRLRADTTWCAGDSQPMGASVGELNAGVAPTGLGLSCQARAAAVNAAHADTAAFTAAVAARVGIRATHVGEADTGYIANETSSANRLAGVAHPVIGV